jgi:hypothetical protein
LEKALAELVYLVAQFAVIEK